MNKRIVLPFALSAFAILLNGCGGESSKINEDPRKGVGATSNGSCSKSRTADCFEFALDYPVAGVNFDCSGDQFNRFTTKKDGNAAVGSCLLGDEVTFYLQGEDSKKISLGRIKLNDISTNTLPDNPPYLRLIDLAIAITGKTPNTLDEDDDTIQVAMALVKIFQSLGHERNNNVIGDIQPTEITKNKRDQLSVIDRDVEAKDLINGDYAKIIQPWIDVSAVSDEQAFKMVGQLLNVANMGVWYVVPPLFNLGGLGAGISDDGFFGCNQPTIKNCIEKKDNLVHVMSDSFFLTDRQGYAFGIGSYWKGLAKIENDKVHPPYTTLTTTVKPITQSIKAQNNWLNPITRTVNTMQPFRFSVNENPDEDLLVKQGKLLNSSAIVGSERSYRNNLGLKENDVVNPQHLGSWQQRMDEMDYNGIAQIIRSNLAGYLGKDIFKTEANVQSKQNYIFPLYATLNFQVPNSDIPQIDLGIMIDEFGDIRTDIKADATNTDMSGICARTQTINADGSITDENGVKQYRVGTVSFTQSTEKDRSIGVRMILANPKLGSINGVLIGLNQANSGTEGAKINIHNLLDGQSSRITLTDFFNDTVIWVNTHAMYQKTYQDLYDKPETDKSKLVAPTEEERELTKRRAGTVTIRIADQNISACKAIKTKS